MLVLVLASCRAESGSASAPVSDQETGSGADEGRAAGAPGAVDAEPDCGADGRVWEGRLEGCLYEHGGCCYASPAAACKAAGCADDSCRILESSPAQLYCG
jgi:hypothetical protein